MEDKHSLRKRRGDKKAATTKAPSRQGVRKSKSNTSTSIITYERGYLAAVILIGLGISYLHYHHVATLFENDRFFSHLSSLERQMSYRTEMGLYYSYYKTMIDAPSLSSGLSQILYDNVTEYPSTINVLKRFNLYPEVTLGIGFRLYSQFLENMGWYGKSCFQITRGHGQPPVQSCEGMGDEAYFYVKPIFALNGLFVGVLFATTWYLGGGIVGGLVTALCFFFNHGEGTRVMWTPPLRESFAVPFLFLQILAVTYVIKARKATPFHMVVFVLATVTFMLPWQFAQFVLLTQTLSLFGCYVLHLISATRMKFILIGLSVSLAINIVMQFANAMLLTSFFFPCLLSSWVVIVCQPVFAKLRYFLLIALAQVISLLGLTIAGKNVFTWATGIEDDAHIGNLLKAKFFAERDFHTSLYLCSKEFDFIETESISLMTKTLLLPCTGLVTLAIVIKVTLSVWQDASGSSAARPHAKDGNTERTASSTSSTDSDEDAYDDVAGSKPNAELLYHLLQSLAFMVMGVLIMRLKLFYTPHASILAGLMASEVLFGMVQRHVRLVLVIAVAGCMAFQGYANLQREWQTMGEFNDPGQEELVEWIQKSTTKNAVFAGAMPTMAGIKLNAYRPIVNHPHYEDVDVRRRTLKVYQIYSRKPAEEVAATLLGMKVNYTIVEDPWCLRSSGLGCSMAEMWDVEDPKNIDEPMLCQQVLEGAVPAPFEIVFRNDKYTVLKVG